MSQLSAPQVAELNRQHARRQQLQQQQLCGQAPDLQELPHDLQHRLQAFADAAAAEAAREAAA